MNLQQTIHATFSAQAAAQADRIALAGGGFSLTYAELERTSTRIARYLRLQGVGRGDRVALYAQRSVHVVAALIGILKAGAAYVPLDPAYPAKLLKFMVDDCSPTVLLTEAGLLNSALAAAFTGTVVELRGAAAGLSDVSDDSPLPVTVGEDLAYIMYTSGSTGHPKGVLIPHRGVVRLAVGNTFADMGPTQVHLQLAPLAFDASTFEIWGALLNGAKLAVETAAYPSLDDIAAAIQQHGVTTLWLTAGLFHLMVDHRLQGLAPLKQLIAGGDVLSPSHVAAAQAALPSCQLINGYGPTENTTFTCCYRIPHDVGSGPIPIGTAIGHTSVHILDGDEPVADGDAGELCTGGAGLALGYLNQPELTAERFVRNPLDAGGSSRLYRTGDRVRRRADGNIDFLGRVDRQVKINGKRVELDEIEACLRRSPLIEDAAVTSPAAPPGARKVHAFVKLRDPSPGAVQQLRDFVRSEAPDYMMPATFTVLATLPLSPTGKIDRARLQVPSATGVEAAVGPAGGTTLIESRLLEVWRQVLGNPLVGVDDNFFDLGGTSLQLLQVHATISAIMQSDVTVVDLFQYPRISALAARLGAPGTAAVAEGAALSAGQRARGQQAALARARAHQRRGS